jgi:hypothetical protein
MTPLVNGNGTVGLVWSTDKGGLGSGLTQGAMSFDSAGGLEELRNSGNGQKILDKGVTVDPGADGVVAWGRWLDGDSKVKGVSGSGKGKLATLHYFAFLQTPTLPALGSFTSFASTAPTVVSAGQLVATGNLNSAYGSINVAFPGGFGGIATYNLTVPVSGQTFTLAGIAGQTSNYSFSGVSAISSTGQGCSGGCSGSLGNNASVIGLIGGAQGTRAGINYWFDSRIGNISGVIVFKR